MLCLFRYRQGLFLLPLQLFNACLQRRRVTGNARGATERTATYDAMNVWAWRSLALWLWLWLTNSRMMKPWSQEAGGEPALWLPTVFAMLGHAPAKWTHTSRPGQRAKAHCTAWIPDRMRPGWDKRICCIYFYDVLLKFYWTHFTCMFMHRSAKLISSAERLSTDICRQPAVIPSSNAAPQRRKVSCSSALFPWDT